jgi:hypothetical protein
MMQEYNPFNYGIPASRPHFVGRWEQIKAMAHDLANPQGHSFALIGGRRFGKSSFLEALQDVLIQKLANTQPGQWHVFPVLVSLKSLPQRSSGRVFAHMLRTLYDYCTSPLTRKRLGLTLAFDVTQTQLAAFHDQTCSLDHFANILEEVIMLFEETYGSLRPVFLLDETEEILEQSWTEEIFSQLRSLIYVGKLRDNMRCVITGSSKIIDVREKGSPLFNILSVVYLEAIDDDTLREIIAWANNVPEDFAQAVLQQSGGHPYLAQFLMHHAWDSLHKGETPPISALINRFRSEAHGSLEQWQTDLGRAGLIAYQILADADSWLTEAQVKQHVQDESLIAHIGPALINLCYHGLVRQRGTWYEYRITGQLFKDWFTDEIRLTLHAHTTGSQTSPTSISSDPYADPSQLLPVPTHASDCQNLLEREAPIRALEGEPIVNVQLPTTTLPRYPTAYYDAMTKDSFPFLVSCEIDNTQPDCTIARITIEVTIQGFSETDSDTLIVPSGRCEQTSLQPRVTREKALSLTETKIANCHVLIKRQFNHGEQTLHNKTYEIQLLSCNTALYALQDDQGKLVYDLADYLAVFVTPHKQEITDFVLEASQKHPDKAFIGYPTWDTNHDDARKILRKQAEAFFVALKNHGLRYIFSPNSFGNQPDHVTQHIRLPWESLPQAQGQKGQASCLDSTLLFASLLESVNIDPLIVLISGHAFVGWHVLGQRERSSSPGRQIYDFLETTMIGEAAPFWQHSVSFDEALAEGNRKYMEARKRGDDQRPFLDAQGFLRVIDIATCRSRNINPLS